MNSSLNCWRILPLAAIVLGLATPDIPAQASKSVREEPLKIGDTEVSTVLTLFGAKMENGLTPRQFEDYNRHFDLVDRNKDGRHSKLEFIDEGTYMTPQARRGIFTAADADTDGVVTRAEYILNRIITDEAKSIVQAMDDDNDRVIQRKEFLKNVFSSQRNEELAKAVFAELDTNKDAKLIIPEYLRVWGKWARAGRESAERRVSAQKKKLGDVSNGKSGNGSKVEVKRP